MKLKTIRKISLYKTIKFNIVYFGIKGLLSPYFVIGKNVVLRNLKGTININSGKRLSFFIGVFDNELSYYKKEYSVFENTGNLELSKSCNFICGVKIINCGNMIIKDNLQINGNTTIICHKNIEIGNNCNFSWGSLIMDTDYHSIRDNDGNVTNINQNIAIGNDVWIGAACQILKGSVIPDGCILSSGSRVSGKNRMNVSNAIITSNYRLLKEHVSWDMKEPV